MAIIGSVQAARADVPLLRLLADTASFEPALGYAILAIAGTLLLARLPMAFAQRLR
jgi:hypothetical protein